MNSALQSPGLSFSQPGFPHFFAPTRMRAGPCSHAYTEPSYRTLRRGMGPVVLAALITLLAVVPVYADSFTVNTTGDGADDAPGDAICAAADGSCTLRAALQEANATIGVPDTVLFNIPGAGPHIIQVATALPPITDTISIDGLTQPGAACATGLSPAALKVEIRGTGTTSVTHGLELGGVSGGSLIRGLLINEFGGHGLRIATNDNVVQCSAIGVDVAGNVARGNGGHGILINNAANNLIGGPNFADRNVIAGNSGAGVYILTGEEISEEDGPPDEHGGGSPHVVIAADEVTEPLAPAVGNRVLGNYIGVNAYGTVALGNGMCGVQVAGSGVDSAGLTVYSSLNQIGAPGAGNLIAGNGTNGVSLVEAAMTNTVSSNYIGVNAPGKGPLANALVGVLIENGADNRVEANLISGNGANGVHIADPPSSIESTGNIIRANMIGLNAVGDAAIPNAGAGVGLQNASHNLIGGAAESERNIISGNVGDGIIVQRSPNFNALENRIENNFIGPNKTATAVIGNGGSGVHLFNAEVTTVHHNVIGGNGAGVTIASPNSYGNVVTANHIGTDPTETLHFGNGEHGVFINSNAHDNRIGGTTPNAGNVIAFHSGRGIWMTSANALGNSIRGNSIYDNQGDEIENKLGIDLAGSGPNPNDLGDIDIGPNKLQNYPHLIGAYAFDGATIVNGFLNSAANTDFAVDIFYSTVCDASGYGEGQFYMESITITTDEFGNAGFSHLMIIPAGAQFVTLTATDPDGNTSEFSNCEAAVAATVVNSVDDATDGVCDLTHCSLREAIDLANAASDTSLIVFGIQGAGPHTIRPFAALPALIHPTTIDGLSQPGATCPGDIYRPNPLEEIDHAADLAFLLTTHSLAKPEDPGEKEEPLPITPTLQIEIDGSLVTAAGVNGLTIAGGQSIARGLTINRFSGNGLVLTAAGFNQIGCNLIGVDPEGFVPQGNGLHGILIDESPANNLGETVDIFTINSDPVPVAVPGNRNIVAANGGNGILVQGALADGNAIYGNYIGVDVSARSALGNGGSGILINAAVNTNIGDIDADSRLRNVIAGNQESGITVNSANASIVGNFVGTDILGTTALGNGGDGIQLNGVMNGVVQSNLIADSAGAGILMAGGGNNLLRANFIGTDLWRLAALSNRSDGILVAGGTGSQIVSNAIVYNVGAGIKLLPAGLAISTGIEIDSNSIHSNRQLGVDLGGDLITPNDIGDLDGGPNRLQNYPVIQDIKRDDVSTTVLGSLSSAASTSYTLQFFANAGCDPLGNGEGRVLLGELPVTTDALGDVEFTTTFATALPDDFIITANATDPGGNTSEFSSCGKPFVPVAGLGLALDVLASSGQPGETLSGVLTVSNLGNLADTFFVQIASDWSIVPSVAAIGPLAPGASADLTIVLTVADDAAAGSLNETLITVTSLYDAMVTDNRHFTIQAEAAAGVALTPDEQSGKNKPGQTISYYLTLTNEGNIVDTFDIVLSSLWQIAPIAQSIGPLDMGETASITIEVAIPADALAGDVDTASITATSQQDGSIAARAEMTSTAEQLYALELIDATYSGQARPGETVPYTLTVVNRGNGVDAFELAVNSDWTVTLPITRTGMLNPVEQHEFSLSVTIPPTATTRDSNTATAVVTSVTDPLARVSIGLATTVVPDVAGLSVSTSVEKLGGFANEALIYVVTITNRGSTPDSFSVALNGAWPAVLSDAATPVLAPDQSFSFSVQVTIPATATYGEIVFTTVTVTSQSNPDLADQVFLISMRQWSTYMPLVKRS